MTDEQPELVETVTEATNGIGSEALAAISNLGGGSSDSIATGLVSRLAATVSGKSGGFAPKVITTITKHGIAGIQRVEPIQGVDRGYRAVAADANGLESIRTVLDLDPREYDVTVTREEGAGVVEFVQQEPEPEESTETADPAQSTATAQSQHARAPVREPTVEDQPGGVPDDRGERRVVDAGGGDAPAVEAGRRSDPEVERVWAEAEKAKAEAEAKKARAEAERARAEAEAAKARAEAERARAKAEAEALESGRELDGGTDRELGDGGSVTEREPVAKDHEPATAEPPAFSSPASVADSFDPSEPSTTDDDASKWGLDGETAQAGSTDAGSGFGEFTAATPVEGSSSGATVADGGDARQVGGADDENTGEFGSSDTGVSIEETGEFEF